MRGYLCNAFYFLNEPSVQVSGYCPFIIHNFLSIESNSTLLLSANIFPFQKKKKKLLFLFSMYIKYILSVLIVFIIFEF